LQCSLAGTRGLLLALAYFIVALLPVIGFVRMAYLRSGTLVADHFQYFADVSLIAFVCSAVAMFARRARGEIRTAIAAIAILLIAMMGAYAWARPNVCHSQAV